MNQIPETGGILIVDKPKGFTSHDVVAKLRGICGTRKIGHGGTLDPMATGVLPVFIGPAAKAVDMQPRQDKAYEAVFLFGIATDTGDITGEVLREEDVRIGESALREALPRFLGERNQLPPLYSAVKLNGKPLYKYAREGKGDEVERKPRPITIHSIDYLGPEGENRFRVRVHCSKGTYIRVLAEEVGEALGAPATLAALRRVAAGVFDLSAAHTLDVIQQAKDEGRLGALLLPVETVFRELPELNVDEQVMKRLLNGAVVRGLDAPPGRYRVRWDGKFLGLAGFRSGELKVEKLFCVR